MPNLDIEDIIEDSKHDANLAIVDGVKKAIAEFSEGKYAEGKLLSPNWDIGVGRDGDSLFLHLKYGAEEMPLPLPEPIINSLYYYQEEALNILKLLVQDKYVNEEDNKHYRKLIINLPTGTGKTRIFLELLAWWKSFNVVVIAAPTISLLRQLEHNTKNFMEARGCDFEYGIICSDKKLTDKEIETEEDETIYDMMMEHGEATININDIYNMVTEKTKPLIIFSTYRSLNKIAEVANNISNQMDLLIGDEGHRLCDKPANQNIEKNTYKYGAFFTATVRENVSNKIDRIKDKNGNVVSEMPKPLDFPMTNRKYFGPIAYKKTPKQMMVKDEYGRGPYILPPKRLFIDWNSEYSILINSMLEHRMLDVSDDIKHEFALFMAGLCHVYIETGKIKNIAFVQSINTAEWYKRNFDIIVSIISQISGHKIDIKPFVISQKVEGFDRVKMLREFDIAKNAIMFNYQVIKEGIDINDCNSIAWMRKMDAVGLMQSLGRALRIDHNDQSKKYGYVICPINTDGNNKGAIIERMHDIVNIMTEEGFYDHIIDERNNSDRPVGRGVWVCPNNNHHERFGEAGVCPECNKELIKLHRDIREIDWGKLSNEEIAELIKYVRINGEDTKIDLSYFLSFEENDFIDSIFGDK